MDWEHGFITLDSGRTKSGTPEQIPEGDMETWLRWSRDNADGCERVFHRDGQPFKEFGLSWLRACEAAGVPTVKFHDLRRTAVGNMRRAGVPQVVRMRISGHRTDSMERRYNIVDVDDFRSAKELMQ